VVAGNSKASSEPLLEIDEIQGNILAGFNTDYQLVWTFAAQSVAGLRDLLRALAPDVTSLRAIDGRRRSRREERRRTLREPAASPEVRTCIGLTFAALSKVAPDASQFKDIGFVEGLSAERSALLGDPQDEGLRGAPSGWLVGGAGPSPDGVLIVACDLSEPLDQRADRITELFHRLDIRTLTRDLGANPSVFSTVDYAWPSGIEHFGFKDGIAQPGVRGRLDADTFLTDRTLPEPNDPTQLAYSSPGKPLVWPGTFVFGYPLQNSSFPPLAVPAVPLGPTGTAPTWARNGSFLVFRRLAQDVPLFNTFLEREVARINGLTGSKLLTEELGAAVVGRWRSGAPVIRAPLQDDPRLGGTTGANDAFAYQTTLQPNDGFAVPIADPVGAICPFSAHIRKVDPRDRTTDKGLPADTLNRRILRRGIPYGKPLRVGATADPTGEERGLLFVAFMASITGQFELLVNDWMNGQTNPSGQTTGFDMLVGQNPAAGEGRARSASLPHGGAWLQVSNQGLPATDWVFPTGGGYFFAPSLSAIRMLGSPRDA
jgi:Dyp-type peroxidase family